MTDLRKNINDVLIKFQLNEIDIGTACDEIEELIPQPPINGTVRQLIQANINTLTGLEKVGLKSEYLQNVKFNLENLLH